MITLTRKGIGFFSARFSAELAEFNAHILNF